MTEARNIFRKFIVDHAFKWDDKPILNYVTELENNNKYLIDLLKEAKEELSKCSSQEYKNRLDLITDISVVTKNKEN